MGVGEDFQHFCSALVVRDRESIAQRYRLITRRLNLEFWGYDSDSYHSFYTGSYGRGTAIDLTSDVDMLFWLQTEDFARYDGYQTNGQSAMLRDVRTAILKTYPQTAAGADGQVVTVPFSDGITFEVLPAFRKSDGAFLFPDSNGGGSWRTTDPKPEIDAITSVDAQCNYNLKRLGRMMRAWKAQWSTPISGLLIDTLAYKFLQTWAYRDKSFLYYDWLSRDFLQFLATQNAQQSYWLAPGSGQYVWRTGTFEYKATRCFNIAVDAITYAGKNQTWSARQCWREIYGTAYPG